MRCLTILLAMGWFLMTPPVTDKDQANVYAPISEWTHQKSFDTAKECENYKSEAMEVWREDKQTKDNETRRAAKRAFVAVGAGRCLPSDSIKVK